MYALAGRRGEALRQYEKLHEVLVGELGSEPSPETQRFWDGCKKHELWVQYCRPCELSYWFPRDFCPHCGSRDVEWRKASGRGRLYTFAIHYRAFHPGWSDEVPYVTALITLDEAEVAKANGDVQALVQQAVEDVNRSLSRFEQIKRFAIVSREFSAEEGEVTPTLKLKRRVIEERFADEIEQLYT